MVAMSADKVAMRAPETGTMPGDARGTEVSAAMSTKMTATKMPTAKVSATTMATTTMATTTVAATAVAATAVATTTGECRVGRERQAAAERENCGQRKE
jgi:hypothetical protein